MQSATRDVTLASVERVAHVVKEVTRLHLSYSIGASVLEFNISHTTTSLV